MKIVTWNCQGYKFGSEMKSLVNELSPDVITLQECGDIRNISEEWYRIKGIHPFVRGKWSLKSNSRTIKYNIFYYPWRNYSRCSMATLVKENLIWKNANCLEAIPSSEKALDKEDGSEDGDEERRLRATIRINVNFEGDDFYICNVHLPSGRPSFARKVGHVYLDCSSYLSSNMIMVGDFNTEPGTWVFDSKNLRIIDGNRPTHESGRILDYIITNSAKSIAIDLPGIVMSDHYPVIVEVN